MIHQDIFIEEEIEDIQAMDHIFIKEEIEDTPEEGSASSMSNGFNV